MKILGRFDFLGPEVDIEHGGQSFTDSIFSLVISIICIGLIIFSIIHFSKPLICRESPSTDIYEIYAFEEGSFFINFTYFSHFITILDYQKIDIDFKFDYYRIVGMQYNLYIYLNYFGGDISMIDHWLYGPCDAAKDFNYVENEFLVKIINSSACIMKYYNSEGKKYYDRDDSNFKWPKITYGEVDTENEFYSIVVEKCKEDTLNLIKGGEGNQCVSDSEFNESVAFGKVLELFYTDNYVNLLDYKNPSNHYINIMENMMEINYLSTNALSFNPFNISTDRGIFFEKVDERVLYEFDNNDISTLPKHPGEEDVFMNYIIKLNNKVKKYERNYKKRQDVFADVGGLVEVICFIAEFIVKYYNEYIVLRHTKKIISHLYYEKEPNNNSCSKTVLSNIDLKNNESNINYEINKNIIDIKKNSEKKNDNKTINQSEVTLKNKYLREDKSDKEKEEKEVTKQSLSNTDNDNVSDDKTVFNEENQDLNLFSYLIHKITFSLAYKKYNIYEEFREKVFVDEQIIKNHIILFNLVNKNKPTPQIYSLKEIINDE